MRRRADGGGNDLRLVLVPYESGTHGVRTGRGPENLLRHGAGSILRARGHRVSTDFVDLAPGPPQEPATSFRLHAALAASVREAAERGSFPLVLSGNCGAAVGALSGLGTADTAVLWLDAHGDFNTPETTTSGYLDGMSLAVLTGRCWRRMAFRVPGFQPLPAERAAIVGVRDLDPAEWELLRDSGAALIPPATLRRDGIGQVLDALSARASRLYIHLDLDVLDPATEGRANPFAAENGISAAELETVVREACSRFVVVGAGIASYDPEFDVEGTVRRTAVRIMEVLAEEA